MFIGRKTKSGRLYNLRLYNSLRPKKSKPGHIDHMAINPTPHQPPTSPPTCISVIVVLWGAMLLHFTFFLLLGLSRHWVFLSSINDLGVFDQVVWNTLHGDFFQNTINPFSQTINWLGFHFHPILLLFVPLYAISPSPEWFTLAQAGSLSLTAWPIFLLARHLFQCEKTALLWAIAYLVNPFLLSAGAWDFHPVTLAVPFLALALLALVQQNAKLLFLSCLPVLACQEHFGPTVAGLGLLWWLHNRSWQPALGLVVLGSLHLVLVLGVVMPFFSPVAGPVMLGEELGQLSRYSWLGTSLSEVFHTLTTQPLLVWNRLLAMGGVSYWFLLAAPFAFLFPLLGGEFLLAGLADLAANTLSANTMPRAIFSYHSVGLIPALTAAAMYGVWRLAGWQKKFSARELSSIVLLASCTTGYAFFPAPLPGAANFWAPARFTLRPDPALQAIWSTISRDTSISAQANVGAHFSQRQKYNLYPNRLADSDAVVLHLASPTGNVNDFPGTPHTRRYRMNWLDAHLQMDRTEYLASIECLISGETHGVAFWQDTWLVLTRQTENNEAQNQAEDVIEKIRELRGEWQVAEGEYQAALQKCQRNKHGAPFEP